MSQIYVIFKMGSYTFCLQEEISQLVESQTEKKKSICIAEAFVQTTSQGYVPSVKWGTTIFWWNLHGYPVTAIYIFQVGFFLHKSCAISWKVEGADIFTGFQPTSEVSTDWETILIVPLPTSTKKIKSEGKYKWLAQRNSENNIFPKCYRAINYDI